IALGFPGSQCGAEDGTLDQHQPSLSSRSFSGRGRLLSGETIFLGGAEYITNVWIADGSKWLDLEYFMYGKVNDKIDVYAFGVVLFELLSGRKPISNEYPKGEESLVMRAKPILNSGKFSQLLDQSLGNNYDADQMERMTLAFTLCIRRAPRARPHMSSVAYVLEVGLPNLLEDGIKMLIYVGKYNLVCNLLGFEASEISEFKVDGKLAGLLKNYGPLTFLEANVLGHQNVALRYEKYRRIKIRIVWDSS
ncbi:probable receptor-like serine/threonine-protein kinase, partial [Tanacetum coccineum]